MTENSLLKIGEAAVRAGTPPKTIRFYEDIGLIEPAERFLNGYRAYREKDVRMLRFVRRARSLGFSLKEVADLLLLYRDRGRASRDVRRLATARVGELDRKIAKLTAIRNSLADLARRCHGDERPECSILDELESPEH